MTAHDPRVTLTEAEREAITSCDCGHDIGGQHNGLGCYARDYPSPGVTVVCDCPETDDRAGVNYAAVEHIVAEHAAARLAPIRALLDEWEAAHTHLGIERGHYGPSSHALRKALDAPQGAPRGPVGGEQGGEVAGGRSEGERPGEGARALREAAAAARGMHDPPAPDCAEWADWLDRRADHEEGQR